MKLICHLHLFFSILVFVAACAAPGVRFKDEAELTLENVRVSNMETLFPVEVKDFYLTVSQGGLEFTKGDVQSADLYYSLALGKAEILEGLYLKALKLREEAARLEFEQKRQAEAALEKQKKIERELAEKANIEAIRRKKLEAEKFEVRRRAERAERVEKSRLEKEVQLVVRHTVKRGETLPQIAAMQEVYGDSSLWPLIYKSNRDQISNPAVLWPGQVLRIPRNADKNDISEARRFTSGRSHR